MLGAFLNLNKPAGITAHGCVARLRKMLNLKKIGHSGTLDPAATGVLPIAITKATRLLRFLPEGKAYRATVQFGITTNTDDLDGEILTKTACPELTQTAIEALLPQFVGQIQQYPPAYSAIKVKGKRLYQLARAGQEVEVPIRTVSVKSLRVLGWHGGEFPQMELAIACGTGTYIRSIARDLGAKLGYGATLANLERTYSNGFSLDNSVDFDKLAVILETDDQVEKYLIAPDRVLLHLEAIKLGHKSAKRWCQGQAIPLEMVERLHGSWAQLPGMAESQSAVEVSSTAPKNSGTGSDELDGQKAAESAITDIPSDVIDLANVRVYTSDRHDAKEMVFLGIGVIRSDFLTPEVVLRKFNLEEIS
ncbi:tRNA pseudouridine synthase B [Thalassoporum mexicanum PCC 7367]|uniref:tRNA pseudouridine(55) synthase TruB n=1 Tax=Thalassoporum mexicanum TaxID=3457544 RepID=UPI00029FA8FD|nr:tRNA pseudouridine(55) synthase TruB [Pseudanabaena sp. PCC 7367]AFY68382.1 tRNA pseudouridine synthase B [Pseudanabaena sp. PCC 7367]